MKISQQEKDALYCEFREACESADEYSFRTGFELGLKIGQMPDKWSDELPVTEGLYVYREKAKPPLCVRVKKIGGVLKSRYGTRASYAPVTHFFGEWIKLNLPSSVKIDL